ncbi:MAG: DUF4870 domain-containing protein [Acidobacteriota bacterium]|jgi:uncharacterized membrane protein|nr:MAG: hypothetical protein DIU54_09400 [Acidobacteriota bacterium]
MSEQLLEKSSTGLDANVAAAISYIPIVAIVFLVIEKTSTFVKFHALQSLGLCLGSIVIWFALAVVGTIPVLGLFNLLLVPIVAIALFVVWLIAVLKAFQNQRWKLPVIGDIAEKQSTSL